MARNVFITYRRDDTAAFAGRVHDRLEREFGRDHLFMDVDAIPLGVNFVKVLEQEVAKCDVLLAIIGSDWLDARDENGGRRLDNANDFVRIEIAAALKRDIPVIPILVDGTPVPKAHQLPEDIKDLALRNGLDVRNASFRSDMEKLIGSLRGRKLRKALIASGTAGAAALAVLAWMFLPLPPTPSEPAIVAQAPAAAEPSPASQPSATTPLSLERERVLKPKDSFKECAQCPEMVVVPAGNFTMGSPDSETGHGKDEGPQHTVTIGKPFAVGKFHVTVDQFAAFVATTGYDAGSECRDVYNYQAEGRSWRNPGFPQAGSHPAVCLNWNDAKAYVDWLARTTGKPYRFLTEAEWEYAARARTQPGAYPRYSFGDDEKDLCRYGNDANVASCDDGYAYTSPVGSFAANGFGLYDMQGNALQWTADCYHDSYNGAPSDGSAWTAGGCSSRVARGGSWYLGPAYLRAAGRDGTAPDVRYNGYGFRVARTLTP
jgi:formylglycine-generating enzyme required for sulfatase activity